MTAQARSHASRASRETYPLVLRRDRNVFHANQSDRDAFEAEARGEPWAAIIYLDLADMYRREAVKAAMALRALALGASAGAQMERAA
jgi:hypothetical protein